MLYIIFVLINFLTLCIGVWLALHHGEIFHKHNEGIKIEKINDGFAEHETHQDEMQHDRDNPPVITESNENQVILDDELQQKDFSVSDNSIGLEENAEVSNPVTPEINENNTDNQIKFEIKNKETEIEIPPSNFQGQATDKVCIMDEVRAEERLYLGEIIEQYVNMVVGNEPNELVFILMQLQEIHNMATEADNNYYASEDAEFFVTPDKTQYATTTICRPKVGRK